MKNIEVAKYATWSFGSEEMVLEAVAREKTDYGLSRVVFVSCHSDIVFHCTTV